jgi:hypothetical protein
VTDASDAAHPLLSEPFVRELASRGGLASRVAGFCFLLALVASTLSILDHAACVKLRWVIPQAATKAAAYTATRPASPIATGDYPPDAMLITSWFGYIAEPSHGLFQLIAVPLFVLVSLSLIGDAEYALTLLSKGDRPLLHFAGRSERVDRAVERWNRSFFRVVNVGALIFSASMVIATESATFDANHLGWVQADRLGQAARSGWPTGTPYRPSTFIPNLVKDSIAHQIKDTDRYPVDQNRLSGVRVHVLSSVPTSAMVHGLFLVFALLAQVVYYTIGFWVGGKILLILAVLGCALSQGKGAPKGLSQLRSQLQFEDKSERYGLRSLDTVYDQMLLLVMIGAFFTFLKHASYISGGGFHGTFFDTLAHYLDWGAPFLFLLVIVAAPIVLFAVRCSLARRPVIGQLTERLEALQHQREPNDPDAPEEDALQDRIKLIQDQKSWPQKDILFLALVGASAALSLIPIGLAGGGPSWLVTDAQTIAIQWPQFICTTVLLLVPGG